MRKRLIVGSLWLLAATISMLVVNRGLAAVGDAARSDRVATVPGDVVDDSVESAAPAPTDPTDTVAIVDVEPADDTPSTTSLPATTTSAAANPPPTTTAPATTAPPTTTTAAPTTTKPPTTTTTTPVDTLAHVTTGGTAWITYTPTSVLLDTAIPHDGYRTEWKFDEDDPLILKVEFESENHKVKIIATWSDGPSFTIQESND